MGKLDTQKGREQIDPETKAKEELKENLEQKRAEVTNALFNDPVKRPAVVEAALNAKDERTTEANRARILQVAAPPADGTEKEWITEWADHLERHFPNTEFKGPVRTEINEIIKGIRSKRDSKGKIENGRYINPSTNMIRHEKIATDISYLESLKKTASVSDQQYLQDMITYLTKASKLDDIGRRRYLGTVQEQNSPHQDFVKHVGKTAGFLIFTGAAIIGTTITLIHWFRTGKFKPNVLMLGAPLAYILANPGILKGEPRRIAEESAVITDHKKLLLDHGIYGQQGRALMEEMFRLQSKPNANSTIQRYINASEKPETQKEFFALIQASPMLMKLLNPQPVLKPATPKVPEHTSMEVHPLMLGVFRSLTITLSQVRHPDAQKTVATYVETLQ